MQLICEWITDERRITDESIIFFTLFIYFNQMTELQNFFVLLKLQNKRTMVSFVKGDTNYQMDWRNFCVLPSYFKMSIMEGPLSKWTNVMKGWQYRWFVLDDNAGLLSYYTVRNFLDNCSTYLWILIFFICEQLPWASN